MPREKSGAPRGRERIGEGEGEDRLLLFDHCSEDQLSLRGFWWVTGGPLQGNKVLEQGGSPESH